MLFVVMDPRWKNPFTCVIAGPREVEKLFGGDVFLNHVSHMMTPPPQKNCVVLWRVASRLRSAVGRNFY